jgi:hypothetical protein
VHLGTSSNLRRAATIAAAVAALAMTASCSKGSSTTSTTTTSTIASTTTSSTTGTGATGTGATGTGATGTTGGGSTTTTTAGSSTAGSATPSDAVTGLIAGLLANSAHQACQYVLPSQQSACEAGTDPAFLQITGYSGSATVVGQTVSGDEALVEVTGSLCVTKSGNSAGPQCAGNNSGSTGMPTGTTTFADAYTAALTTPNLSPFPCQLVDGKWYVSSGS